MNFKDVSVTVEKGEVVIRMKPSAAHELGSILKIFARTSDGLYSAVNPNSPQDERMLAFGDSGYSGDLGRPVRRDAGRLFRRMAARVGAQRRWARGYLSQVADGVKLVRVFRIEPPFRMS